MARRRAAVERDAVARLLARARDVGQFDRERVGAVGLEPDADPRVDRQRDHREAEVVLVLAEEAEAARRERLERLHGTARRAISARTTAAFAGGKSSSARRARSIQRAPRPAFAAAMISREPVRSALEEVEREAAPLVDVLGGRDAPHHAHLEAGLLAGLAHGALLERLARLAMAARELVVAAEVLAVAAPRDHDAGAVLDQRDRDLADREAGRTRAVLRGGSHERAQRFSMPHHVKPIAGSSWRKRYSSFGS